MAKRICSICGEEMAQGYCFDGGLEYYCSEQCLHQRFTDEEWDAECEENENSYWTEWHAESYWEVRAYAGSVTHHILYCDTEEEALQFCYDHNWYWLDENEFEWGLEVNEPID